MSQKLEDRLHLYERDHPIRDDQELISALEAILEEQDELPAEDRDFDLISEATDAVLHLSGYSNEQLSDMADKSVERIFSRLSANNSKCRKKTHLVRSKIAWIIIAIIVLTITSTAISASVLGINIPLMTKEFVLSLKEKVLYNKDNKEAIRTNDVVMLSSLFDLDKQYRDYNLILPLSMIPSVTDSEIIIEDLGDTLFFDITLVFSYQQKAIIQILHEKSPITVDSSKGTIIFTEPEDSYQAEFYDTPNHNSYLISSQSKALTEQIVYNMEERNENNP